jgi:antirestriction protein ArdC
MQSRTDLYSKITNKIIADLQHSMRTWFKPWSAEHTAGRITRPLRSNFQSYNGVNVLVLWSEAVTRGYSCPVWITYIGGCQFRRFLTPCII